MIRHDIHGLQMNTGVADGNGALWYVDGITGWDAPNLRQGLAAPTGRHGEVLTESMYGSRPLVVKGVCKAVGEAGLWVAYNDLLALSSNLVVDRELIVYESTPKKVGYIRAGKPRIDIGFGSSFTWELPLLARSAVKRALTSSTKTIAAGASATITMGQTTFESYPVITAAAGNLSLTLGGGTLKASGLVGSTVFDTEKHTAYRGGINEYTKIDTSSVWWALQPGANVIKNNGTSSVSIVYTEVWI